MNTYIVKSYRPDTTTRARDQKPGSDGYAYDAVEVRALNAPAALNQLGYHGSMTRVEQNHPDEAVRDNAHIQTHSTGRVGAQAIRKDGFDAFQAAYAARKAHAAALNT